MCSDEVAIRVEGLGKRYLLPQKHTTDYTLAPTWVERLKEFFPKLLGADEMDFFWSLRNVSFEVRRGEVLGVVGENGSGKSTLLKILSGVTPPTEGFAEIRGRVGSLLEVGTGFHPDLTGRENILFNGSLLGVGMKEIRSKLDAIIEFSGIGEFIDVPVKRYSSGMYVRLAYSVASLLQSEIMILDEVLAVGDAAFRSKSEQNIRASAAQGRTILLVSHNPRAIATICDRAMILYKGRVVFCGAAKDVIAEYLSNAYKEGLPVESSSDLSADLRCGQRAEAVGPASGAAVASSHIRESGAKFRTHTQIRAEVDLCQAPRFKDPSLPPPAMVLKALTVSDGEGNPGAEFSAGDRIRFKIRYAGLAKPEQTYFCLLVHNSAFDRMMTIYSTDQAYRPVLQNSGTIECIISALPLGVGVYSIMVDMGLYDSDRYVSHDCITYATFIRIKDMGAFEGPVHSEFQGAVCASNWSAIA